MSDVPFAKVKDLYVCSNSDVRLTNDRDFQQPAFGVKFLTENLDESCDRLRSTFQEDKLELIQKYLMVKLSL